MFPVPTRITTEEMPSECFTYKYKEEETEKWSIFCEALEYDECLNFASYIRYSETDREAHWHVCEDHKNI